LHSQGKASCATALKQVAESDDIGLDGAWNDNRGGSKLLGCQILNRRKTVRFRELLTTCTYLALKFSELVTDGDFSIGSIIRKKTQIRHN
jgi:hypothetical protein